MFSRIYEKVKQFILDNYKFLINLIIIILLFTVELPYVIYKPGGSINLNNRVIIDNNYKAKGSFEMAYVSLARGSIPFLLAAKIIPDWDIAPKSEITYSNESVKDAIKKDKIALQESIDNATIVAYRYANKELKIKNIHNNVVYITDEADTNIREYDQIVAINNQRVNSLSELKERVNQYHTGDILNVVIIRNNKKIKAYAKVYDVDGDKKIGVIITTTYDLSTNPRIKFKKKRSESGPSGGIISALSIYNSLIKKDITKGRKIIGTGTIDINGNVGAIGGVKYKLMGAVKNKADIFICPEENIKEAIKVAKKKNYDIKIIGVNTFEEAINYLEK